MADVNALSFVESAQLAPPPPVPEGVVEGPALDLDKLPAGVVSGNTLIDFSATASVEVRSGVSMAFLFASRAADAAPNPTQDEDIRFAAYMSNLRRLGFGVSQTAMAVSRFKKDGLFVHKAIIPFLTIALGGAGVGPVILAALDNLSKVNEGDPWITLFDRQTRKFSAREMQFAAVSSDPVQTVVRHVAARLTVIDQQTNVLFFKLTKAQAEFESATTSLSANNNLLAIIEPKLREKMENDISSFIAEVPLATG
jgi:hypothetical protein